jgi:hypothetical protein
MIIKSNKGKSIFQGLPLMKNDITNNLQPQNLSYIADISRAMLFVFGT